MQLIIATNNAKKVEEFQRILSPFGIETISMKQAGIDIDIDETGATFAENSLIKAKEIFKITEKPTVADDSGLCVDALGGRPGVYSAVYQGDAPYPEKIAALLGELSGVPEAERTARFECVITCVLGGDDVFQCAGTCEGIIGDKPAGGGGFGYDPVFMVGNKSFAQLTGEEKDAISHRGKALRSLAKELKNRI